MSLPEFKVTIGDHETQIKLNGRTVASAWGPAADKSGNWFACHYGEDPRRFPTEKEAREFCSTILNMPLPDWATNGDAPEATGRHGYTDHGHPCCGKAPAERPNAVARCGGARLCSLCALQAAKMHTGAKS